jgi:hypothetical protein
MAWPWDTLGLREDATPLEVQKAWNAWRARSRPADDPEAYARMEQAFAAAQERAADRDPSRLPAASYPVAWSDATSAPANAPAATELLPAEELVQALLIHVRNATDYEAFAHAIVSLNAWRDPQVRAAADCDLREQIAAGVMFSSGEIVRLSRLFEWQPESMPLQPADRDQRWRQRVQLAWAELAPPDAAYTSNLGRVFLGAAILAGLPCLYCCCRACWPAACAC